MLELARPVCGADHVARRCRIAPATVGRGRRRAGPARRRSDGPVADADRVAPLRAGQHGLRHLHVGFDRSSEGRGRQPRFDREPACCGCSRVRARTASDVVLHKTPTTFDVSVWELFGAAAAGARLVVAAPDGHRDPAYLAGSIDEQRVTIDVVRAVDVGGVRRGPAVRECSARCARCWSRGEALPAATALRVACGARGRLHNLYGPTECDRARHGVEIAGEAGAGPDRSSGVEHPGHVLDARLHPVPVGVPGELYLAGASWPGATSDRPGSDGGPICRGPVRSFGTRMYRTGDLVRWTRGSWSSWPYRLPGEGARSAHRAGRDRAALLAQERCRRPLSWSRRGDRRSAGRLRGSRGGTEADVTVLLRAWRDWCRRTWCPRRWWCSRSSR